MIECQDMILGGFGGGLWLAIPENATQDTIYITNNTFTKNNGTWVLDVYFELLGSDSIHRLANLKLGFQTNNTFDGSNC